MKPPGRIRSFLLRTLGFNPTSWLRGDTDTGTGGAELGDIYSQSEIVYACVQALADGICSLPFRLYGAAGARTASARIRRRQMSSDDLDSGPAVDLFDRPHPQLSRFDFWELLVAWIHLRGSAFVVALDAEDRVMRIHERGMQKDRPSSLVILPASALTKIVAGGRIAGWNYWAPTESPIGSIALLPEELLQIRLPGLSGYTDGLAPGMIAQVAAQGDYAAAQFMRGLMLNNADQGVIVSTEQWLTEAQRNQVLSALRERKRKAGTADRPLLLGGGLKVEKPTISNVDLQYIGNRDFNRRQICAVFRVPESILGFTADANRSVGIEQRANFIQFRVGPLAERLAAAVRPIVQMFDPGLDCYFDLDDSPAMQEVRRTRFAAARAAMEMGVPLNDLNTSFDLGLPEYAWGHRAYIPFGLQEVGADDAAPAPVPVTDEKDSADGGSAGRRAPAGTAFAELKSLYAERHTCSAHSAWLDSIAASTRKKKAVLRSFFFAQRTRVLKGLESSLGKAMGAPERRVLEDFDPEEESKLLAAALKPGLLKDLEFGGAQIWKELALPDQFKLPPERAIAFLGKREKTIKDINDTTFASLKDSLSEGLASGDTYQQMVDRVKEVYSAASQSRAETIAMTETNVAINSGRYDGMREAGVEKKAWLASDLAGSRPAHQQASRDYEMGIPIDEPFRVDGEYLDHPGDPNGSPGNTINCRCTILAILDEKSARTPRFMSFAEWTSACARMPVGERKSRDAKDIARLPIAVLQPVSGVLQPVLAPDIGSTPASTS